jgi:hypothetical protein
MTQHETATARWLSWNDAAVEGQDGLMPERAEHTVPDPAPAEAAAPVVVEIHGVRATLLRALRILVEAALVPTALLAILLHSVGLPAALGAAVGWCYLTVAVRWYRSRHLPGTLLLCAGMFSGRAAVALATSSAFIYLLQPVVGSVVMALLFLGSAAVGRPVTVRLARDFVSLPAEVLARRGVRRVFTRVALLWGASRVADAAMNVGFLHFGVDAGLLSRGLLSPLLTAVTVGLCTWFGWRAMHRDGVKLKLVRTPAPATA